MKRIIILLSLLLVVSCSSRRNAGPKLFVSISIQDSLERFINEVGVVENEHNAETVATVSIRRDTWSSDIEIDTLISFFISYFAEPKAIIISDFDSLDIEIPTRYLGYCFINDRKCFVRSEGIEDVSTIINNFILKPVDEDKDSTLEKSSALYLTGEIRERPKNKEYRLLGRDSIKLIEETILQEYVLK